MRHNNGIGGWLSGLALAVISLSSQAAEPVKIGWVKWADAEIAAKLAKVVLEKEANQPVTLQSASIGIHFQAIANGTIDIVPMVWLPTSHGELWANYKDKLDDLGVEYQGKVGVAVPSIVPESEVATIDDLNKPGMKEKFGGMLLTSEAGNGQYKLGQQAIKDYNLDGWKLVASSETGMLTELDRRLKRNEWSLINAWSPHWMFAKWPLRYLTDTKGVYGGPEEIHVVARKGFAEQNPKVANFFRHYKLKQNDLEKMMNDAREAGGSDAAVDKVVLDYYEANKATFAAMLQ
ncbi:glycine betaine ABC transporter substrate-binding protein [Pseudomonas citri]|uniref:glycine betaine ABC transporter substrate-binding protein n=1 Tax=Pseudomonas citri TaxID=2978349 RepID=UPI0021B59F71|nr:glycine betaine ABC transporter substrate-binding protein [Pseudomonas citri]